MAAAGAEGACRPAPGLAWRPLALRWAAASAMRCEIWWDIRTLIIKKVRSKVLRGILVAKAVLIIWNYFLCNYFRKFIHYPYLWIPATKWACAAWCAAAAAACWCAGSMSTPPASTPLPPTTPPRASSCCASDACERDSAGDIAPGRRVVQVIHWIVDGDGWISLWYWIVLSVFCLVYKNFVPENTLINMA